MKLHTINISGRDLVFGTHKVPPGQPIVMASADAHEFARDGLVQIVPQRVAQAALDAAPAEPVAARPAPKAKV